jgi:NitT/TauT family transport system substrate-binding protein
MKTLFSILIAIAILLTACGDGDNPTATIEPPTPVKFQFSWVHNIEFVGAYMAQENGYYADENLDVELVPGGYDEADNFIVPIDQVVSGEADFGVADALLLVKAREDGQPVVAVAALFQRHPLALASLSERNITRLEDLVGATVHMTPTSQAMYYAMLATQDIDPSEVNEVERTDFTIAPIVDGDADVIDAWVTNEVVDLTLAGYEINFIMPSDYGIDVYPNVIFTTEEMIANNPDVVQRFVNATVQGLRAALDDSEKAAEAIVKYNDELEIEAQKVAMQRAIPLINPQDSPPGMMQAAVWEQTLDIALEQKVISAPIDIEEAYTLQFLEEAYAE